MCPRAKIEIIEHGGESYLAAVQLRDEILVNPAGVVTTALDVAVERELTHVAGFLDREVVATCLLVPEAEVVRMKRVAVASSLRERPRFHLQNPTVPF